MIKVPIKNEWKNEKTFIIGGGPSVQLCNINELRGIGRVIVTNNAYKLAPWADYLVFLDMVWYEWHKEELKNYEIPKIAGFKGKIDEKKVHSDILVWPENDTCKLIPPSGKCLVGNNTGHAALSLATYLGSNPIFLIGFDMQTDSSGNAQWHNEHKRDSNVGRYITDFIPQFYKTSKILSSMDINVYNTNKYSALQCFKYMSLKDAIDMKV